MSNPAADAEVSASYVRYLDSPDDIEKIDRPGTLFQTLQWIAKIPEVRNRIADVPALLDRLPVVWQIVLLNLLSETHPTIEDEPPLTQWFDDNWHPLFDEKVVYPAGEEA